MTSKPITWYLWNATQLDILWAEILQNSPVLIHWQWWFGSVLFKAYLFRILHLASLVTWYHGKNPELSATCHTFYGECNFQTLLTFINFIWSHSHKTTFQQRRWNSGYTGYTLTSQVMVMDGVGACLHPHSLESPIGPPVYQGDDASFIFIFVRFWSINNLEEEMWPGVIWLFVQNVLVDLLKEHTLKCCLLFWWPFIEFHFPESLIISDPDRFLTSRCFRRWDVRTRKRHRRASSCKAAGHFDAFASGRFCGMETNNSACCILQLGPNFEICKGLDIPQNVSLGSIRTFQSFWLTITFWQFLTRASHYDTKLQWLICHILPNA